MIQQQSYLDIADNSGAKTAMCMKVLGGSTPRGKFVRKTAGVGDIIMCVVKKALPNAEIKDGQIVRAVIVRTRHAIKRPDGSYIRFDKNAAVIISKEDEPVGSRIFGAVARELREKGFLKIVSLASEVV
jgi:large subunit ribosomal protein L14